MARRCGIFVEEFSVGMGPILLKHKTKRDLLVSLRLLPIGGFCRMKGEEPDPEHPEALPEPASFNGVSVGKRALVVAAGPVMNFILAFVLLLIFNMLMGFTSRQVAAVDADYPAAQAGLEAGDTITGLNGESVHVYGKISFLLMNYQEGEEVKLEAKSADGTRKTLSFQLKYDEELQRYRMGFTVAARGSLAEEISRQGFFPALGEVIAESFWYTGFEIEVTIRSLGMLDTRAAIVLPTALSVFNIMITRTSFKSIPEGLMDAARIDGAGHIRILVSIVIPVSKAIIAVITLFSAVQIWNSWFHTAIYVRKRELYPLQIVLREIVLQNSTQASDAGEAANEMNLLHAIIRYCVIMLSIIPMLFLYPFIQKYFVTGVMIGSIKG